MNSTKTMAATKISAFLNDIEHFGIEKTQILASAGIDPELLNSPDNRLTETEVDRIFKKTAIFTRNENIGLIQGEKLSKGFSNILGYILVNCCDLEEASQKYLKYERIVDETSVSEFQTDSEMVILSITNISNVLKGNRQLSDFKLSGLLSYTQILTGKKMDLKEVYFDFFKPKDTSEYQRIFNCPIYFEKPRNAFVFDKALLKAPIVEPNRELLLLFEGIAGNIIDTMDQNESMKEKILNIMVKEFKGEIPAIDVVAKHLAVSVRSLQGYLKREGTSYIKLANEVRKDIAITCLKKKNASIAEIAYILGFSETSSFNRAFKKWTHQTPSEFRS